MSVEKRAFDAYPILEQFIDLNVEPPCATL